MIDVKAARWIHKDVARQVNVTEDIVRRIYSAVQIAKRQGLHGGHTVDLIERSVGRRLTLDENHVAYLAREHLGYNDLPCGYEGPQPRGSAKAPPQTIDRVKVNEAMHLVSVSDAIITDVIERRNRSARSRKPSFRVPLNKAAALLSVAARVCARAGATIRAGTLHERAKYAEGGNFDMLALYNRYDIFQEDR